MHWNAVPMLLGSIQSCPRMARLNIRQSATPSTFPAWTLSPMIRRVHPLRPLSHPFVERLIGTLRREYLDCMLFWTTADLENKLLDFRTYFNSHRTQRGHS
jgi:hypothetical protein